MTALVVCIRDAHARSHSFGFTEQFLLGFSLFGLQDVVHPLIFEVFSRGTVRFDVSCLPWLSVGLPCEAILRGFHRDSGRPARARLIPYDIELSPLVVQAHLGIEGFGDLAIRPQLVSVEDH